MNFVSFPIPDRQVPASPTELASTLEEIHTRLGSGQNCFVHCRQGIGRARLAAACLPGTRGWDLSEAVKHLRIAREVPVPETHAQRQWIDHFAAILAGTK